MRECLHTLAEAFAVCHPAHMWQLSETYAATEISKSRWFRGLESRFEPLLGGGLLSLPPPGCVTPPGAVGLWECVGLMWAWLPSKGRCYFMAFSLLQR